MCRKKLHFFFFSFLGFLYGVCLFGCEDVCMRGFGGVGDEELSCEISGFVLFRWSLPMEEEREGVVAEREREMEREMKRCEVNS